MYVTHDGIPAVTLREIQRLKPVGIGRYNDVQAFVVGAANNPGVIGALQKLGVKYKTVNAPDPATLANQVDQLYGSIANPHLGHTILTPSPPPDTPTIAPLSI